MKRGQPPHLHASRAAVSLIEIVTVIALMGTVIMACGLMMHGLLTMDRTARREDELMRAITELSHQFRRDVHQATQWQLSDDQQTFTLAVPEQQTVVYQLAEGDVTITRTAADQMRQREEFHLPGCQIRCEFAPDLPGWTLHLQRPPVALQAAATTDRPLIDFAITARASRFSSDVSTSMTEGSQP
ncbi:hypothetical protein GC163_15065 [bacterium]|nr:hypothetical protein [bacterium]